MTTAMPETAKEMGMGIAMALDMVTVMMPLQLTAKMSMKTMGAIQGWRLDDGDWTLTVGQQRCMLTMTVTTAMADRVTAVAMAMAMATAMMLPLSPLATLLMKMTAAIQGWQFDDGNLTTAIG